MSLYIKLFIAPGRYQFQIDYITYSAGGNCVNLHLFLHPTDNFTPDAERFAEMKKDVYKMLFDNRSEERRVGKEFRSEERRGG